MVFRKKKQSRGRFSRARAYAHRRAGGSLGLTDLLIGGAIYGFARPKVADMIPPLFNFGPVDSDNVIIGGAGYLGMKSSNKIIKATSMVALAGEAAIVANRLANGTSMTTGSTGADW